MAIYRMRYALLHAAAIAISLVVAAAQGQPNGPLSGQGVPPEKPTEVFLSVGLKRLLSVEDDQYRFTASFLFYFTWQDDGAWGAMNNATTAANAAGGRCGKSCATGGAQSTFCCDNVWLPNFEITNMVEIPQGYVPTYTVEVTEDGQVSWQVAHLSSFYTPLDFKAHPFDHQHFQVQIVSDSAPLLLLPKVTPSSVGMGVLEPPYKSSVQTNGWDVLAVTVQAGAQPVEQVFDSLVTKSAAKDGAPWNPVGSARASNFLTQSSLQWDPHNITYTNLTRYVNEISVTVHANRYFSAYLINNMVPIVLCACLGFVAYWVPLRNLESRLTILVTCFLALTAVLFVVSTSIPYSSYIVPLQQHAVASYFVLAAICIASLVVYQISLMHDKHKQYHRMKVAVKQWKSTKRMQMEKRNSMQADATLESAAYRRWASTVRRRRKARGGASLDSTRASIDSSATDTVVEPAAAPGHSPADVAVTVSGNARRWSDAGPRDARIDVMSDSSTQPHAALARSLAFPLPALTIRDDRPPVIVEETSKSAAAGGEPSNVASTNLDVVVRKPDPPQEEQKKSKKWKLFRGFFKPDSQMVLDDDLAHWVAIKLDFWLCIMLVLAYFITTLVIYYKAGRVRLKLPQHVNKVASTFNISCHQPAADFWNPHVCAAWVIGTPCCD